MKIYKLLFFLFAFIGFHSCAEYVGNGEDNGGGSDDTPSNPVFVAKLVDNGAERVGETFEFTALLNGVNVTETTTFRVNGTNIEGHTYIPFRADEHSVIATKDDYTASFRFNVLDQNEVNRIEYDGQSYPVSSTTLSVFGNFSTGANKVIPIRYDYTLDNGTKIECTRWRLLSIEGADLATSTNALYSDVYVPFDENGQVQYPHEADVIYSNSGITKTNGSINNFYPTDSGYPKFNFVSFDTQSQTANYTIELKKGNEFAKLYWNGEYDEGYLGDIVP